MSLSTPSRSDAGPSYQYTPSANSSLQHQNILRHVTTASLWACPVCKSNPEFWFFILECRGYWKENLRDLMRFHVFVGDKPDAGKFSFHEKYNNKLLKVDPDNPNIYNREIFKQLRDWLAENGGKWDNRPYNEQRWKVMYEKLMHARKGGPTIPSAEINPYFDVPWLRIALQPRHAFDSPEAVVNALNVTFGRMPDLVQYLGPHIRGYFEQLRGRRFDDMLNDSGQSFLYNTDLDLDFEGNVGWDQGIDLGDQALIPTIDIDHDPMVDLDMAHVTPRATFPMADIDHAAEIAAGSNDQVPASHLLNPDNGSNFGIGLQPTHPLYTQPATNIHHAPSDFDPDVWDGCINEDNMQVPGYTRHRQRTRFMDDKRYLPLTDHNTMLSSIQWLDGSNVYQSSPQTLTAPIVMARRPSFKRRRVDSLSEQSS